MSWGIFYLSVSTFKNWWADRRFRMSWFFSLENWFIAFLLFSQIAFFNFFLFEVHLGQFKAGLSFSELENSFVELTKLGSDIDICEVLSHLSLHKIITFIKVPLQIFYFLGIILIIMRISMSIRAHWRLLPCIWWILLHFQHLWIKLTFHIVFNFLFLFIISSHFKQLFEFYEFFSFSLGYKTLILCAQNITSVR